VGEALGLVGCASVYKAAVARCFHRPTRGEVDFLVDSYYPERSGAAARAAYLATLRHVRTDFVEHAENYRRAIGTLDHPVLLVHGRQDPVVPAAHCSSVADGVVRGRVRFIDDCGHFPQIEQPAVVNGWLRQFLVGRPAPR
jgi:pimeloyl-ACP methyl ester carboxylesterase